MAAALGLLVMALVLVAPPAAAQAESADLVIRQFGFDRGAVAAGGSIGVVLEFVNRGPADVARNTQARVTFNKPVAVSITGTNPAIACSGGNAITCTAGNAGEGVRFTVRASVRLATFAVGNLVAQASVTSAQPDPDPGNGQSSASVPISSTADLVLSQSISPNPPQAGGNATVRPSVTNRGPSNAQGVVITLNVPGGVTLLSASAGCSAGGGRVICAVGNLAAGATATVQAVYGLGGLAAGSQITASASVRSNTPEGNGGNNAVAQSFSIGAATADVGVRVSANPNPASVGTTVMFTIAVTNAGPSVARGVVVTDPLPPGLRLRATQAPGACSALGTTIICNVGTLGAGASATVTISATVLASARPGPLVNRVSVRSDTADRNPGNDAGAVSLTIRRGGVSPAPQPNVAPPVVENVTLPGELPPTGGEAAPLGAASILFAAGVLLVAAAYRGRRPSATRSR